MSEFWLRVTRVLLCVIFIYALVPKRSPAYRMGLVVALLGILILTEEIVSS